MAKKIRQKVSGQRLFHIGERGLLGKILPALKKNNSSRFLTLPGDDAAVLKNSKDVLSIDGLVEGVHFKLAWAKKCSKKFHFSFGEALGWKALGSALSDLAAMGDVNQRWAMVFLGAPKDIPVSLLLEINRGITRCAKKFSCTLVGGDTVGSKILTLVVAVGGKLKGNKPLMRSGAQPGDYVAVSGNVGEASVGLDVLEGKLKEWDNKTASYFAKEFFWHCPRFKEAQILSKAEGIHSMMDISDSLHESLDTLTPEKKWGVDINLESIPRSLLYRQRIPLGPKLAAAGENYSLIFTVNHKGALRLGRRLRFSILGRLRRGKNGIRYFLKGKEVRSPKIFRHF